MNKLLHLLIIALSSFVSMNALGQEKKVLDFVSAKYLCFKITKNPEKEFLEINNMDVGLSNYNWSFSVNSINSTLVAAPEPLNCSASVTLSTSLKYYDRVFSVPVHVCLSSVFENNVMSYAGDMCLRFNHNNASTSIKCPYGGVTAEYIQNGSAFLYRTLCAQQP